MRERATVARNDSRETVPRRRGPTPGASAATRALTLQRFAGNRVTSRMLARWIKHPDQDKKGVMVPDVVADEFVRFNPPKNE
jgi:hypothetical protein